MIQVPTFNTGDVLTAASLTTLADAIIELQTAANVTSSPSNAPQGGGDIPDTPVDLYSPFFPVQMDGVRKWHELTASWTAGMAAPATLGIITFTDGRKCTNDTDPSAAITLGGTTPNSGDFGTMIEIRDGPDARYVFIPIGKGNVTPVLLKQNGGSDGSWPSTAATWSYDLYALSDIGYVTKLNLSGPIVPYASRAEAVNSSVTAAADGTVGFAYFKADGTIDLYLAKDFIVQNTCTETGGGSSPSFMGV